MNTTILVASCLLVIASFTVAVPSRPILKVAGSAYGGHDGNHGHHSNYHFGTHTRSSGGHRRGRSVPEDMEVAESVHHTDHYGGHHGGHYGGHYGGHNSGHYGGHHGSHHQVDYGHHYGGHHY